MYKDNVQIASLVVKAIKNRYYQFSHNNSDKQYVLIDNENNIITEMNCDGPLVEFKMLANDGSEYFKLRSPNDISVKIKEIK